MNEKILVIAGETYDLNKEPEYQHLFFKRLDVIGTSPTRAIRLMCFQCSGYNAQEANICRNKKCPLYVLKWNRKNRKNAADPNSDDEKEKE